MLINKAELAEQRYPGMTFDCALPQGWVDQVNQQVSNVVGHFVWLYPKGNLFGIPAPVTELGDVIAMNLGLEHHLDRRQNNGQD